MSRQLETLSMNVSEKEAEIIQLNMNLADEEAKHRSLSWDILRSSSEASFKSDSGVKEKNIQIKQYERRIKDLEDENTELRTDRDKYKSMLESKMGKGNEG